MANQGRPGGPRGSDEDRGERGREHYREHEKHGHGGDDPKKHAAIVARRWEGSPPPTAERYAQALKQWHALPGAVMWPATDVSPLPPTNPAPDREPKP
jgi:hypothetical protein